MTQGLRFSIHAKYFRSSTPFVSFRSHLARWFYDCNFARVTVFLSKVIVIRLSVVECFSVYNDQHQISLHHINSL